MAVPLYSYHRCNRCQKYTDRIKELEEINDMHRRTNGELREAIAEWTSTTTKNDTEKR